ncbi:netrin receptor unc-5-like [Uranotaenia lowii]|uniref:netrin receptor unc-5-like n=1 Tax=Uranotaenia lowii TaxID=190385 RepID=UPI00247A3F83|nr:netrin receptor unc-5-like [Uranotaenia lowii]XP_055600863.1 netrin receptor unc-5-like [Uranotaenia lowii]
MGCCRVVNKVTLLQLFIVLLVASGSAAKVNKERKQKFLGSAGGSTAGIHPEDHGYISDSHGLPTKFGDEDDVIFAKNHKNESSVTNAKPPSLLGGSHGSDYDYDYEEELDHPDDNDSRDLPLHHVGLGSVGGSAGSANVNGGSMSAGASVHGDELMGVGDYTDGYGGGGEAIDQIESFGEGSDSGSLLPVFLVEPQSAYVIKNRPAVLQCKASHAFQLSFKCSGGHKPALTAQETHVDPHTGVQLQEATTEITRELVDEFFGRGPYKCDCLARSSRGLVRSQPATIQVAYIKRQISIAPKSIRVELGGQAQIVCNVNATPVAKISWLKNGVPLVPNPPVVITVEDKVLIAQVTMQDMANYTCVAENIAGKRISDPVTLTVYVDGGWSSWGPLIDCKCPGQAKQGQKRIRVCNNPAPLNNGAPCVGPNTDPSHDCLPCSAGRWSHWSDWSECAPDCTQTRHRSCIGGVLPGSSSSSLGPPSSSSSSTSSVAALVANSTGYEGQQLPGSNCLGKNFQSAKCTGGACNYSVQGSNWTIYVGLALTAAICIAIGAGLTRIARRKKTIPAYNLARSEMPSEYFPTESKKLTHFQPDLTQNTVAINYEYPLTPHHLHPSPAAVANNGGTTNPPHHLLHQQQLPPPLGGTAITLTGQQQQQPNGGATIGGGGGHHHHQHGGSSLKNSLPFPRSSSEHHYDVPHLCNNYMYPVDKISINDSYSSSSYSKRICSVESLGSLTNTSGESTYDQALLATNNTLPIVEGHPTGGSSSPSTYRSSDYTQMTLTPAGALMRLNTYAAALLIPEGAISKHQKQNVVLSIVRDDKFCITGSGSRITFLSPVVYCGPPDTKVLKPVVLKVPHCAENLSNWQFSLYHSVDNGSRWSEVVAIGRENINTPAFVQIDKRYAYVLTELFGKYVLVGESANDIQERMACKKLRMFICGPSTVPEFSDVSVRIYIVEDNPGAEERCRYCEQEIGGVVLGKSSVLYFSDNSQDLCIDIRCVGGWKAKPFGDRQVIPFLHVWNNSNSTLHCSFTLSRTEHDKCDFKIDVQAVQENCGFNVAPSSLSISSFTPLSKDGSNCQHSSSSFETMTICSVGSNSANGEHNVINTDRFRLTKMVKRKLCKCLDPPTQKGNDWRMLAAHLHVDRYLAYFATKPSPTDQILDLWECRNRDLNAVCSLMEICRNMGRMDAVNILQEIQTPSWL